MAADGFITDLKRKFQQGDIVLRLVNERSGVSGSDTGADFSDFVQCAFFAMDELSGTAGMDGSFYP